jgi:hypothetical protein
VKIQENRNKHVNERKPTMIQHSNLAGNSTKPISGLTSLPLTLPWLDTSERNETDEGCALDGLPQYPALKSASDESVTLPEINLGLPDFLVVLVFAAFFAAGISLLTIGGSALAIWDAAK